MLKSRSASAPTALATRSGAVPTWPRRFVIASVVGANPIDGVVNTSSESGKGWTSDVVVLLRISAPP